MTSKTALSAFVLLLLAALCAIPVLPLVSASGCISLTVGANGTTTITSTSGFSGVTPGDTATETDGGGHIPSGAVVVSVSGDSAVLSEASSAASGIAAQFCSLGSLSVSQGPAGTTTTISGSGFSDSHTYSYCYESDTSTPSACPSTYQFTTDSSGNIPSGITVVASGASNGYVVVYDISGTYIAFSAPFTITTTSLTLTPSQGPTGTTTTLSGSGYAPSYSYNYCFESGTTSSPSSCSSTYQFTTTGGGAIPSSITLDVSGTTGLVAISDPSSSTVVGSSLFTVTTPAIVLTPSQGPVGTSVSVSGSGFSVNTAIGAFTYHGSTPSTQTCTSQTTSSTGSFSCSFTVPSSTGSNPVVAAGSDAGSVSADTATMPFTISSTTLNVTPLQGPSGVTTTLSGSGYADSYTYNYCYEPSTASATPCSSSYQFTTSGSGGIPGGKSVVASGATNGLVVVSDPGSNTVISIATFTITTPQISLNPTTGSAGTVISVTGSGFSVDTGIDIFTFGGVTPATQTCTSQTTSSTGTFSCTFTSPTSAGAETVTASGADLGSVPSDTASTSFASSIAIPPPPTTTGGILVPQGATYTDMSGNTWAAPGGSFTTYFFADPITVYPAAMQECWGGVYGTYNGQQGWIITFY